MSESEPRVPRVKIFAYSEEDQTQSAFAYSLLMAEKKSVTEVVHEWKFRLRVAGIELNDAAIAYGYQITEIKHSNINVFSGRAIAVKLAWVTCEPRTVLHVKMEMFDLPKTIRELEDQGTPFYDSCEVCFQPFPSKRGMSRGKCPGCSFLESLPIGQVPDGLVLDSCDLCGKRFQADREMRGICPGCVASIRSDDIEPAKFACGNCGAPIPSGLCLACSFAEKAGGHE
jgi:hypothetical protein